MKNERYKKHQMFELVHQINSFILPVLKRKKSIYFLYI